MKSDYPPFDEFIKQVTKGRNSPDTKTSEYPPFDEFIEKITKTKQNPRGK